MNASFLCLSMVIAQPADAPAAFIDRELAKTWQTQKLTPAAKTNDYEFLRRVSLDLIGRIPTRDEQAAFLKDPLDKRRGQLVERLLSHKDYPRHWANVWTDRLLSAAGSPVDRADFHGWLQDHFAKDRSHKVMAEQLLLASGSTRDNPASQFISAYRGEEFAVKRWNDLGQFDMHPLTGHAFRVFHGTRLQCVQCHDHPFHGNLFQSHFHEMNMFFRQVGILPKAGNKKKFGEIIKDEPKLNENGILLYERRNGVQFGIRPRFYDQGAWNPKIKQSRREFFTERFVKHPDFARAHVHFLWARLFGHGLTETRDDDDFGEHNPVVQEKILTRLAADFVKSGHDSKAILRTICNCEAYSLKSVANPSNAGDDKARFHARMQVRMLSREQLAESLVTALTGENKFNRRDELRVEILKELGPASVLTPSHCEIAPLEPENEISLGRALWIMNSKMINREISAPDGTVARVLEKRGRDQKAFALVARDLFTITLVRPPLTNEAAALTNERMFAFRPRPDGKKMDDAFWGRYAEDVYWALLNCNEFALNH